jgi:hypothetical protein
MSSADPPAGRPNPVLGGTLGRTVRPEVLRERPELGVPQEVLDRAARLPDRTLDPDRGRPEAPDDGPVREPFGVARTIDDRQLTGLVRDAVGSGRIRWLAGGGEAVVHRDRTRAAVQQGVVLVAMTLQTDQTGEQELTATFAVGSAERDAGLLATTHRVPEGHVELARAFGEAVVATAWQALLAATVAVAAGTRRETTRGAPQPVLLRAAPGRLTVVSDVPDGRA